jgi:hypothetical protein
METVAACQPTHGLSTALSTTTRHAALQRADTYRARIFFVISTRALPSWRASGIEIGVVHEGSSQGGNKIQ